MDEEVRSSIHQSIHFPVYCLCSTVTPGSHVCYSISRQCLLQPTRVILCPSPTTTLAARVRDFSDKGGTLSSAWISCILLTNFPVRVDAIVLPYRVKLLVVGATNDHLPQFPKSIRLPLLRSCADDVAFVRVLSLTVLTSGVAVCCAAAHNYDVPQERWERRSPDTPRESVLQATLQCAHALV